MTPRNLRWMALAGLAGLVALAGAASAEDRDDKPPCPESIACPPIAPERGEPAPAGNNATCMDGAGPGEDCDPNVQYFGGPGSPPSDPAPQGPPAPQEPASQDQGSGAPAAQGARTVPAAGGLALLAVGIGALAFGWRRHA